MQRKPTRSRSAKAAPSDTSKDIEQLHARLKTEQGVTDVKFAFGEVKDQDADHIFGAVTVALRAAAEKRTVAFGGVNDSYGRKRRVPK